MFNYKDCMGIVDTVNEAEHVLIEKCSDFSSELDGFYVILIRDKVNIVEDYICSTIKRNVSYYQKMLYSHPTTILKMLLSTDNKIKTNTYTELFVREFGGIQGVMDYVHSKNISSDVEEHDSDDDTGRIKLVTEKVDNTTDTTPDGSKPENPRDIVYSCTDELLNMYNESLQNLIDRISAIGEKMSIDLDTADPCKVNSDQEPEIMPDDLTLVKSYLESFTSDEVKKGCIRMLTLLNSIDDFRMISSFLDKFSEAIGGDINE